MGRYDMALGRSVPEPEPTKFFYNFEGQGKSNIRFLERSEWPTPRTLCGMSTKIILVDSEKKCPICELQNQIPEYDGPDPIEISEPEFEKPVQPWKRKHTKLPWD